MGKQSVVYPHNGILFSHKKEWNAGTGYSMNESWKPYAKYEKPDT